MNLLPLGVSLTQVAWKDLTSIGQTFDMVSRVFFKYRKGSNFFMSSWDLSQFTLNYPIFSEKSNHPNTHTYAHWCRKRFPVSIRDILYVTHIFSDWLYMYDICNMHVLCTFCIVHSTDSIEKFAICFLHQSVCHNLKLISPPHSSPVIPKILLY